MGTTLFILMWLDWQKSWADWALRIFLSSDYGLEKSPFPAFPLLHPSQYVQSDVKKGKISKSGGVNPVFA